MEQLQTSPDLSLSKFLAPFRFKLLTVSVQPETTRPDVQVQDGKFFSRKNRVRAVTQHTFYSPEFQEELKANQAIGCAIYFTINEGDGVPTDQDNLNCGKRTNIKTLRALAIDTDNADTEKLLIELKTLRLQPHIVVRSSANKFHLYFLIEPVPAEGENVLMWQALQRKLASLVPELDQTMADINQVLRLPTFYNMKAEPQLIKLINANVPQYYNLKFLYDRLEAHTFNTTLNGHTNGFKTTYTKFEFPQSHQSLPSGSRRDSICKYIEHIMENVIPLNAKDEDYYTLIDAFIIKYLKPQDANEFLEGGARRANIVQYLNSQRDYRIRKHQSTQSQEAIKEFDHIKAVEDNRLTDDFYLNFPGDLGMLTKHIHNYAPKMSLELAFAGALAVSGALKADSFRYRGAWPLVNGLVIAGTGAGKSILKSVIEEILLTAGYSGGPYSQLIDFQNTVQSLHRDLYAAGGVGTTLVDESGDYLQMLSAKNAPGYVKALKKYFKESTTGRGKGTRLSPGNSLSFTIPAIAYGMLSIWIFIQPNKFEQSLTIDDMGDGFLPRFFIFNGESNIQLTSTYHKDYETDTFKCNLDLEVWCNSFIPEEAGSLSSLLKQVETDTLEKYPKSKPIDIRIAQRDAVYEQRSESRILRTKNEVVLTDEAQACVISYLQERNKAANELQRLNSNDPQLGIFIRMEEMLNRLICNSASHGGTLSLHHIEQCIKFHRFQTDRFFRNELQELIKPEDKKEQERVLHGLRRAVKKHKTYVTIKQIYCEISTKPKNVAGILKTLVANGDVWMEEREHAKFKHKKVTIYGIAQDEEGV